jgi:hypothetical protein
MTLTRWAAAYVIEPLSTCGFNQFDKACEMSHAIDRKQL